MLGEEFGLWIRIEMCLLDDGLIIFQSARVGSTRSQRLVCLRLDWLKMIRATMIYPTFKKHGPHGS